MSLVNEIYGVDEIVGTGTGDSKGNVSSSVIDKNRTVKTVSNNQLGTGTKPTINGSPLGVGAPSQTQSTGVPITVETKENFFKKNKYWLIGAGVLALGIGVYFYRKNK